MAWKKIILAYGFVLLFLSTGVCAELRADMFMMSQDEQTCAKAWENYYARINSKYVLSEQQVESNKKSMKTLVNTAVAVPMTVNLSNINAARIKLCQPIRDGSSTAPMYPKVRPYKDDCIKENSDRIEIYYRDAVKKAEETLSLTPEQRQSKLQQAEADKQSHLEKLPAWVNACLAEKCETMVFGYVFDGAKVSATEAGSTTQIKTYDSVPTVQDYEFEEPAACKRMRESHFGK